MRKFRDIETGKIVTEEQLAEEYTSKLGEQPETYKDMTLTQYINNCMTRNNGTLEEISMEKMKTGRLMECVFDATATVYGKCGLIEADWWEDWHDSRDVYAEIKDIAEFYEDYYPEDDEEYLTNIDRLTRAWFKNFAGVTLTDEEEMYLCCDQKIAEYIRKHIPEGWSKYDYDCWENLEHVLGCEIDDTEYHKINGQVDDLMELGLGDRDRMLKMLEEIRNPMKDYVIRIVQHRNVDFSVVVKAHSKEEAFEVYEKNNDRGDYDMEWIDAATCFAEIIDEHQSVEEVEG